MKKRIFVMLLCFALLLGLLPVAVLAVNHISQVALSVEIPQHGATPAKPEATTDKVSVYAYEWQESGNKLNYGETFTGGKTYTLKVRLATLDEFMQSVSVKVNGRTAQVLGVDNNNTGLLFEIDFYVTPLGYKLSFDPGYGSGTMAPLTGKNAYILPECTFTPPAGKEFRYWQIENKIGEYRPGENIVLTQDTTVRAVWGTPSGKTKIYHVEATSNMASIAVLYGSVKAPNITVIKGKPATVLVSAGNLQWQKKVDGNWQTQSSGRFTAGQWRVQTQVRIDGEYANQYELGNPTTLKVDGVQWTMENNGVPNVHHNYSMISVYSPSITIKDDPSAKAPEEITKVALTVNGYKLGEKTKNAKVTCDHKGVLVTEVQFAEMKDTNNDGIPDSAAPVEKFEAGKKYAVSFSLKAKTGYDISSLGMTDVTCNGQKAIGAYQAKDDCYNGMAELPPFLVCTVSFSAGGGTGKMAAQTVEKGTYILPQNEFTAPEGKKFKAWKVGDREYEPGKKISLIGSITVTAVWEAVPADHICKPERVKKVAPTCTEDGKEAYFRCAGCGKFFEDEAGKKEIAELSVWGKLEKLGHTDENKDGECDVCSFVLTVSADAELHSNSKPEETTPPTDESPVPATGKDSMVWLWIVLPIVLALGVAAAIIVKKKNSSK